MPHRKETKRAPKKPTSHKHKEADVAVLAPIPTKKVKIPLDIPELDPAIDVEEKPLADDAAVPEEEVENEEELDEEEIDPFKDKWEE